MDFPSYVPEGARNNALHFLGYYEPALVDCEQRLLEIEEEINYWLPRYAENHLNELRRRKVEEKNHQADLERDIASIKRLVFDERMKIAYQILANVFFGDKDSERQKKIDGFFYAAWSAWLDFSPYRERLKQAAELRDEITKTANKLADLLDRIGKTGVMCPSEFFSVHELLRNTDNYKKIGYNPVSWTAVRGYLLGETPRRKTNEATQNQNELPVTTELVVEFFSIDENPNIDPAEQVRNTLRYAWEKSPPLSALLMTVSKAAKDFEPKETGLIGAALASRQRNVKTEYLRAFGNLLTEQHRLTLTTDIMKAMAIAATVVINNYGDVSEDDVRKLFLKTK